MPDLALSAGELASMRHTVNSYLAGTAVIHTRSTVSDGQGGQIETYAAAGTVSALLAPLTGSEMEIASRLAAESSHMLTVPSTSTVAVTDRVVYASRTYEVTLVKAWTPYAIHRRVCVSEIA